MSKSLSDIYTSKVLLNEESGTSNNVVAPAGKLKISKDDKEHLENEGGDEKVKKDVKKPVISKEYTGTDKVKESMQNTTNRSAFGGTFEKLFKATLTESDVAEDAASDMMGADETVPTTPEAAHDEIHDTEDEVTDLADDLRSVIQHLESILDKVSGVGAEEPSEGEEHEHDEDHEFEESFKYDPELKAAPDKSGVYQGAKKANTVKSSNIKYKGGKATGGKIVEDPELKAAPDKSGVYQGAKKANTVKSSNIKVGDFFR